MLESVANAVNEDVAAVVEKAKQPKANAGAKAKAAKQPAKKAVKAAPKAGKGKKPKAAAKAAKSGKTAAKAKAGKTAKTTKKSGPSNRLLVFQALRGSDGKTKQEIAKAIKMDPNNGQLGVILRGEVKAQRLKAVPYDVDGRDVLYFVLSARGAEHLKKDLVDAWAKEHDLVAKGRGEK